MWYVIEINIHDEDLIEIDDYESEEEALDDTLQCMDMDDEELHVPQTKYYISQLK